jgi:hypothetical protein
MADRHASAPQGGQESPVRAAARRTRKVNYKVMLCTFLVVMVISVLSVVKPGGAITVASDDVCIGIACDDYGKAFSIPFTDIVSCTLLQDFVPGQMLSGKEEGSIRFGTFQDDAHGQYLLFQYKKVDTCILVQTADQNYIFTSVNTRETEKFYADLQKKLAALPSE